MVRRNYTGRLCMPLISGHTSLVSVWNFFMLSYPKVPWLDKSDLLKMWGSTAQKVECCCNFSLLITDTYQKTHLFTLCSPTKYTGGRLTSLGLFSVLQVRWETIWFSLRLVSSRSSPCARFWVQVVYWAEKGMLRREWDSDTEQWRQRCGALPEYHHRQWGASPPPPPAGDCPLLPGLCANPERCLLVEVPAWGLWIS